MFTFQHLSATLDGGTHKCRLLIINQYAYHTLGNNGWWPVVASKQLHFCGKSHSRNGFQSLAL